MPAVFGKLSRTVIFFACPVCVPACACPHLSAVQAAQAGADRQRLQFFCRQGCGVNEKMPSERPSAAKAM